MLRRWITYGNDYDVCNYGNKVICHAKNIFLKYFNIIEEQVTKLTKNPSTLWALLKLYLTIKTTNLWSLDFEFYV